MSVYSNDGKPLTESTLRAALEELKEQLAGKPLVLRPEHAICAACSYLRKPCCEEHAKVMGMPYEP